MKFIITSFFIILFGVIYSQSKGHLMSISMSNNGQINDILNEFYSTGSYGPGNDTYDYKRNALKLNLKYEYLTINNYSIHCGVGFGYYRNSYSISNLTLANGSNSQNFFNFSIGSKYNYSFDKFQISTGIEIPFYYVGTFIEKLYWDNQLESQIMKSDIIIDDGFTLGLNSVSSIKYYLTKKIFISTDIVFGVMHFNLGGVYNNKGYTENTIDPSLSSQYEFEMERMFKTILITGPELHFGLGIKIN